MFQLLIAYHSPDAAWILLERWEALTPEERGVPDLLVELRSPSAMAARRKCST